MLNTCLGAALAQKQNDQEKIITHYDFDQIHELRFFALKLSSVLRVMVHFS